MAISIVEIKKIGESWDFASINPDFLSWNLRKLTKNIGKIWGQSRFSPTLGSKVEVNWDILTLPAFWALSRGELRLPMTFPDFPWKFKKSRWPTRSIPTFVKIRDWPSQSRKIPTGKIKMHPDLDLDLDPTRPDPIFVGISRPYLQSRLTKLVLLP